MAHLSLAVLSICIIFCSCSFCFFHCCKSKQNAQDLHDNDHDPIAAEIELQPGAGQPDVELQPGAAEFQEKEQQQPLQAVALPQRIPAESDKDNGNDRRLMRNLNDNSLSDVYGVPALKGTTKQPLPRQQTDDDEYESMYEKQKSRVSDIFGAPARTTQTPFSAVRRQQTDDTDHESMYEKQKSISSGFEEEQLRKWLSETVGLAQYTQILIANDISLGVLQHTPRHILQDIGISIGHSLKICNAAKNIDAEYLEVETDGMTTGNTTTTSKR